HFPREVSRKLHKPFCDRHLQTTTERNDRRKKLEKGSAQSLTVGKRTSLSPDNLVPTNDDFARGVAGVDDELRVLDDPGIVVRAVVGGDEEAVLGRKIGGSQRLAGHAEVRP